MYDFIIVGGGPTGMTLALYLQKKYKVLIIDREKTLGGCHRVRRTKEGLFTEHGPRIYIDRYLTMQKVMADMNMKWDDYFVPYDFEFTGIGFNTLTKVFTLWETIQIILEFLRFIVYPQYSQNTTVKEWSSNMTKKTQNYLDRICRLTDGAGSNRYTLYEFLQLFNQNALYKTYQPNKPMDEGLIKDWESHLNKTHFMMNSTVERTDDEGVYVNGELIKGRNVIFAIPPVNLKNILHKSGIYDEKFSDWANESDYITYIPYTLHFKKGIEMDTIWGLTENTPWGLVFVNLDSYMNNGVLSLAITKPKELGFNNKTTDECTQEEMEEEMMYQLRTVIPNINPDKVILSPGVYKDEYGLWKTRDTAFVLTKEGYHSHTKFTHLGPHDGSSSYVFTSMESAIESAVSYLNKYGHTYIPIERGWEVKDMILILFLVILLLSFF